MTGDPGQKLSDGERVVALPDLDEEFTAALGKVEELLLTLRWQETGHPDDLVVHPPALGGGMALQALRRVDDTVRPTQTDPEIPTGPRLLGPDGRYEHVPLRFVRVRVADVDALSAVAAALGEPARTEAVTDALRLHAGHRPQDREFPDPDAGLVCKLIKITMNQSGRVYVHPKKRLLTLYCTQYLFTCPFGTVGPSFREKFDPPVLLYSAK